MDVREQCIKCRVPINLGDKYVSVYNSAIEEMPEKISLCGTCAEAIAMAVMTGNIIQIVGLLKELKK